MTGSNGYTSTIFLDWEELLAIPHDERFEIVAQRINIHHKGILARRVWRALVDREDDCTERREFLVNNPIFAVWYYGE